MVVKNILILTNVLMGCLLFSGQKLNASEPGVSAVKSQSALKPSRELFRLKQQVFESTLASPASSPASAITLLSQVPAEKSKGRAFLQSLILPGWGQYYAGSGTAARAFIVSEVALWGSFVGFTVWSNWLQNDFETFAATHAGTSLKGKSESYVIDVGNFNDITAYNQFQLRNRNVAELYPENPTFSWQWDSEANRIEYRDWRKRSARASDRATFMIAAIFTNHIISAIHSTLAVHKFNKKLAEQNLGFRIDFDGYSADQYVKFEVSKSF